MLRKLAFTALGLFIGTIALTPAYDKFSEKAGLPVDKTPVIKVMRKLYRIFWYVVREVAE